MANSCIKNPKRPMQEFDIHVDAFAWPLKSKI